MKKAFAARLILGAVLLAAVASAFLLREQISFAAVATFVDSLGI